VSLSRHSSFCLRPVLLCGCSVAHLDETLFRLDGDGFLTAFGKDAVVCESVLIRIKSLSGFIRNFYLDINNTIHKHSNQYNLLT